MACCGQHACACQPFAYLETVTQAGLLLLVCLQDLLESPHLTLELMSIMDTLPKNLDTVSMCTAQRAQARGGKHDRNIGLDI
jgi:hypothetical protein